MPPSGLRQEYAALWQMAGVCCTLGKWQEYAALWANGRSMPHSGKWQEYAALWANGRSMPHRGLRQSGEQYAVFVKAVVTVVPIILVVPWGAL